MMGRGMVLCEVITHVVDPFIPINIKNIIYYFFFHPMIFHIPRFRSFPADGGIEKSSGGVIVCFEVCGTLAVVKFLKGDMNWDSGSVIMM